MALRFATSGANGFRLLPVNPSTMLSYSVRAGTTPVRYFRIDFGRDRELLGVAEAGKSM